MNINKFQQCILLAALLGALTLGCAMTGQVGISIMSGVFLVGLFLGSTDVEI